MKAKQVAEAARKIEARVLAGRGRQRARGVRTRVLDPPVAPLAVIPHKPGKKAVIVQYGIEDVNACDAVLRFNEEKGSIGKIELKRLDNICRQIVMGWLAAG